MDFAIIITNELLKNPMYFYSYSLVEISFLELFQKHVFQMENISYNLDIFFNYTSLCEK